MKEKLIDVCGELRCGECRLFNIKADMPGIASTCKRLDHKRLKFATPYFAVYDCGRLHIPACRDFEPAEWCKYLHEHWTNFDDYYAGEKFTGYVSLILDGDNSARYHVKTEQFIDGSFITPDGILLAYEKEYYKKDKSSPLGQKLVREEIDGVKIPNWNFSY